MGPARGRLAARAGPQGEMMRQPDEEEQHVRMRAPQTWWAPAVAAAMLALGVGGCGDPGADLDAGRPEDRRDAIDALAKDGSEEAVERLEAAVSHADRGTAMAACRGLGRVKGRRATGSLIRVLQNEKRADVKVEAAVQLARRREAEATQSLRWAVENDPDPKVRAAAAAGLGKIGDLRDVPLLVRVAETDPEMLVEASCVRAVERMLPVGFRYDPSAPVEERRKAIGRMRFWAGHVAAHVMQERQKQEVRP